MKPGHDQSICRVLGELLRFVTTLTLQIYSWRKKAAPRQEANDCASCECASGGKVQGQGLGKSTQVFKPRFRQVFNLWLRMNQIIDPRRNSCDGEANLKCHLANRPGLAKMPKPEVSVVDVVQGCNFCGPLSFLPSFAATPFGSMRGVTLSRILFGTLGIWWATCGKSHNPYN